MDVVLNPIVSKRDKSEVNYAVGKKCANCVYFIHPSACQQVEGYIAPEAVCNLFAIKESSSPYDKQFFEKEYHAVMGS